jgi:hypothetical protein
MGRGDIEEEKSEIPLSDLERLDQEYAEAKQRLDALLHEASALADRFERLARALSAHPARMLIGAPGRSVDNPGEWDVFPSHPLPRIESLGRLTDDIRAASVKVDDLRERLILSDRIDVVEQPDGFFH